MSNRYTISPPIQKQLSLKNLTAEEVLRKALGIKTEGFTTTDGKHFPEGTVFIGWYKAKAVSAIVKNGVLDIDGKTFGSLSAAAAHYTGRATTNGWDFWYVKFPGKAAFVPANEAKAA